MPPKPSPTAFPPRSPWLQTVLLQLLVVMLLSLERFQLLEQDGAMRAPYAPPGFSLRQASASTHPDSQPNLPTFRVHQVVGPGPAE